MLPLHHFENAPKVGPSKEGKVVKLDHPGNFTEPWEITMFYRSIVQMSNCPFMMLVKAPEGSSGRLDFGFANGMNQSQLATGIGPTLYRHSWKSKGNPQLSMV